MGLGAHMLVYEDTTDLPEDLKHLSGHMGDTRVNGIYHRTKAINELCRIAKTKYVGIWDTDPVFNPQFLGQAIDWLEEGVADFVWPYGGKFWRMNPEPSARFAQSLDYRDLETSQDRSLANYARGGAIIVNREKYMRAGGENEYFIGYGPEDSERFERLSKLGVARRTSGDLYHMHHPMTTLSQDGHEFSRQSKEEFQRILAMRPDELAEHVKTWPWYKDLVSAI